MKARRELVPVAILTAAFAAAVAIVDPRGNFPLDDDWDFTLSTWNLVRTGTIRHTPFTSAIAVLQYYWGALWTLLFGQSCTVLRLSTLALSFTASLLVYAILRRLEVAPAFALFAALAFSFHPLIFWASFTYMTHVPELVLGVGAFALLCEALRRESDRWLAAAVLAAVASFFVRQIGIVNALAPLVGAIAFRAAIGPRWKKFAAWYGAACALFAVLIASGALLVSQQELKLHMQRLEGGFAGFVSSKIVGPAHYGFFNFQNTALFFLPLAILALSLRPSRRVVAIVALWFGATSLHMLAIGRPIPYPMRGNVFVNFTLGPPTLRDTFVFRMPYPFHVGTSSLVILMVATTLLAVTVASVVFSAVRNAALPLPGRIAAIYCICGTLIAMFMRLYFDRYSIDTMWPFAILVPLAIAQRPPGRFLRPLATAALAICVFASIAGTSEYLSWNRARWTAFRWLQSRGVTLEQMDGGYEINAILAIRTGQKDLGKEGFAVRDDRFILAFNEVPGYRTLATFPYRRLMGPDGVVRAMERVGGE